MEGYELPKAEMRRTLEKLAADAAEQKHNLERLGVSWRMNWHLSSTASGSRLGLAVEARLVSPDTASTIHSLKRTLETMSGEANARRSVTYAYAA